MASDALLRGKHDAQAVDGVGHMIGQVDIVADRGLQGGLFTPAEREVIGLVVQAERLVGANKRVDDALGVRGRLSQGLLDKDVPAASMARMAYCACASGHVLIDRTSGLTEASASSKSLKRGTEDRASGKSVRFAIVRAQRPARANPSRSS
jgi:hypothetical protein